jgi:hypothetical protein
MGTFAGKKGSWKYKGWVYLLLMLAGLSACASKPTHYLHPTFDFSLVKKIAVIPLENLTPEPQAGEKVRKMVVSEFLAVGVLDVIEPGQVNQALGQQGIRSVSIMSPQEFKKLGDSLGVQAIIVGSVDAFERIRVGGAEFAEVTVTLRAVDTATGAVLWSANNIGGGVNVGGRLFGLGGDTLSEAVRDAVRPAVATLFQ